MNAAKKEGLTIEYFISPHKFHNPYGQTKNDMIFDSVKYGLGKEESINLYDFQKYLKIITNFINS